jgi:cytochrome c oxidase subunit III
MTSSTFDQEVHGSSEIQPHDSVAHHFDDAEQQHDAAELGMWCFLVTEVMFFGGVILAFFVYRGRMYDEFVAASRTASIGIGTINTMVLLTSSLTMALAVSAALNRHRTAVIRNLIFTIILGSVFIGFKLYEYSEKFQESHVPFFGLKFAPDLPPGSEMYFVLYFIMTGIHAVHMIIGIGVLIVLTLMAASRPQGIRATPVELTGLYWHFVDIVWIFLFPFLYLIQPEWHGLRHFFVPH